MTASFSAGIDLNEFCHRLKGEDYLEVLHMISGEIHRIQKETRMASGRLEPRLGSRAGLYRQYLQQLLNMLVNGRPEMDPSPDFLRNTAPLVDYLLLKLEIGDLRNLYSQITGSSPITQP